MGGKDSVYLVHKLKTEYGLRVLAHTTDIDIGEVAWANIKRTVGKLDVEHAVYRPPMAFYRHRPALDKGQLKPDPSRARFIQLARAAGETVVDTEPLFQAHFAQSHLKSGRGALRWALQCVGRESGHTGSGSGVCAAVEATQGTVLQRVGHLTTTMAQRQLSFNRLAERVERIERRLDLAAAP